MQIALETARKHADKNMRIFKSILQLAVSTFPCHNIFMDYDKIQAK